MLRVITQDVVIGLADQVQYSCSLGCRESVCFNQNVNPVCFGCVMVSSVLVHVCHISSGEMATYGNLVIECEVVDCF